MGGLKALEVDPRDAPLYLLQFSALRSFLLTAKGWAYFPEADGNICHH